MKHRPHLSRRRLVHCVALAVSAALAAVFAGPALAFEIDVGNPDIEMRWDNTFRYNLGGRVQSQNPAILGAVNNDDGDRNFSNGSLVTSRLDVLSEFDVIWKKQFGARFSAALWWDPAYDSLDNSNTLTANTLVNGLPVPGVLSPYSKRYLEGASGEWLDAFAFANFDVAGMPMNIKAGQHTVFWGDSLLLGGAIHGVSYAQNSLDILKGFATPGAEAKELFRPRGGLTLQLQPTTDLSLAAQWFYNWQAVRAPESGSYLTANDGLQFGGDSLILGANPFAAAVPGSPALLRAWNNQGVSPSRYSASLGDWGISARWSPAWLDGTLGFYYRNATDILPQVVVTPGFAALPAGPCNAIGGIVVGAGGVHHQPQRDVGRGPDPEGQGRHLRRRLRRRHPHLRDHAVEEHRRRVGGRGAFVPGEHAAAERPGAGAAGAAGEPGAGADLDRQLHAGPRGRRARSATPTTALVNALGTISKTALFDSATYLAELTWMRWDKVTQNPAVFQGRESYTAINKVSRDFVGLAINFTPTWFQVFPGRGPAGADVLVAGARRQRGGVPGRQRGRRQLVGRHRPPTSTRSTGST